MYDFYFGSEEEILADPAAFLLGVKRTLPRWLNGLPDPEFLTLINLIQDHCPEDAPVFVETGVGASTLVFVFFAMMRNGQVFSWDTSSEKASYVRSVCADAIEKTLRRPAVDRWTFVGSMSLAPYTGISILQDLTERVDMTHHDSNHTWETVSGEIEETIPLLAERAVVCVDDVHHEYQHTYEPVINMTRKKLGLPPIGPLAGNKAAPHLERIPKLLGERFDSVEALGGEFANAEHEDLYYKWYGHDRKQMNKVGLDPLEKRRERFAAWLVSGRKSGQAGSTA